GRFRFWSNRRKRGAKIDHRLCYTRPTQHSSLPERRMDPAAQVTMLLVDLKNGDPSAVDRLIPLVYDELRRLAAHYLRDEHVARRLQPTALVHEAYMKLVAQKMPDWESRS